MATILDYFLNRIFGIFWWLLRLKKVFLVKSEDNDVVDYLFIVNFRSSGGHLYFVKLDYSWGWRTIETEDLRGYESLCLNDPWFFILITDSSCVICGVEW